MDIRILCVGKLKEKFYTEAAAEYEKRLSAYCRLQVIELPEERLPQAPSRAQIDGALKKEGEAIRAKIPAGSRVVALCIEGQTLSSEELARKIERWGVEGEKHLCLLIGGSYGLDEELKKEAALRLSMSPMTFPHHLARIMLLEQLYRAFKISEGSTYHK